jgi:hypothetical protein
VVDAGDYPERVTLRRLDAVLGGWADLPTTPTMWAGVEALGEEKYRVRIRFRADVWGFKQSAPTLRVYWRDRVLDVVDIVEGARHHEVSILANGHQIETENLEQGARRTQAWPS